MEAGSEAGRKAVRRPVGRAIDPVFYGNRRHPRAGGACHSTRKGALAKAQRRATLEGLYGEIRQGLGAHARHRVQIPTQARGDAAENENAMKKRNRWPRRRRSGRAPRTHHFYPKKWQTDDWLVPFGDGEHACLHHGHPDPDDHSGCGPTIFCCSKACASYTSLFPDSVEAHADWQLTEAAHIATWMDTGVNVLFFVFCDPERPDGLLVIGLGGEEARQVLIKKVPLDPYAGEAQRLR